MSWKAMLLNVVFGIVLSVGALPLLPISAIAGRGGSLVLKAKKTTK